MSLRLRADGCNDLPSMENWLNAGADWTEHHGIEVTPTASAELFYERTTQTASTTGDTTASLFETLPKEQPPQQQQALTTHPFLKLDTLELCKEDPVDTLRELCKEDPEALLLGTGSSSMVDSSSNEVDEVSDHVANSTLPESTTGVSLDRTPLYADETNLYLEVDSPRGPLSPAALQLGKSPRTTCTTTTTTTNNNNNSSNNNNNNNNNKRPFDDLQAATPTAYAPFVAMANSATPATTTTFLPATPAASSGILFPTPLTLPTVPSMEEIAQSRPKRRNVKISTDPQSVAARHRRERISDRVRVLQHFVPGGTKMDTASMLDEAIHYVKFLQQQLQTLERLGNSYDARFMTGPGGPVMMPQVGNNNNNNNNSGSSVRPFDLNCAVYQTFPCTSMMMQSASPQPQNVTAWPSTSSFCSQGFPDSAQEQFCH